MDPTKAEINLISSLVMINYAEKFIIVHILLDLCDLLRIIQFWFGWLL